MKLTGALPPMFVFGTCDIEEASTVPCEESRHVRVGLVLQERIGIDVNACPEAFWVSYTGDGKVEMKVSRAGISGIPDVSDRRPSSDYHPNRDLIRAPLQVCVVKHEFLVRGVLVDRDSSAIAVEKSCDLAIRSGDNRRSNRSGDIDGVMETTLGPGGREGVDELIRSNPQHRN